MGKASSAKKVARAARAGGRGARGGPRRSLLFPATVTIICVLGVSLIAYARTQTEAEAQPPGLTDHWHAAYAVRTCGEFEPPFTDQADPNGVHTHSDGVIHIHPGAAQQVARTGEDATLGVFMEAVGAELTDDRLVLPDGTEYVEGEDQCGGSDAIVQVAFWARAGEARETDPRVLTEDLADLHFDHDGEAYTIAFAPRDADLPPPDTVDNLAELGAVDSGVLDPPSTSVGGGPTPTTGPGGPTTVPSGSQPPPTTAATPPGG